MRSRLGAGALLATLALLAACGGATTSPSTTSSPSSPSTSKPPASTPVTSIPATAIAPGSTTTTPPAAAVASAVDAPPTAPQIDQQLTITHEVSDPTEGFIGGSPVTVPDGSGGSFTAVDGTRYPSADGHGDLIFFWHDQTFLGWDTDQETWNANVTVSGGSPDEIEVTYPVYTPGDPACCPTLPGVTINYGWSAGHLTQSATLPSGSLIGIAVTST